MAMFFEENNIDGNVFEDVLQNTKHRANKASVTPTRDKLYVLYFDRNKYDCLFSIFSLPERAFLGTVDLVKHFISGLSQ